MSIVLETADIQIDTIGVQAAQEALDALTKGTATLAAATSESPQSGRTSPHGTGTTAPGQAAPLQALSAGDLARLAAALDRSNELLARIAAAVERTPLSQSLPVY